MQPRRINPTELTKDEAIHLYAFLLSHEQQADKSAKKKVFHAKVPYGFASEEIDFKYPIVRYSVKKGDRKEYRYAVCRKIIGPKHTVGKGAYGVVYDVLGKLKPSTATAEMIYIPAPQPTDAHFKPEKRKVVKREEVVPSSNFSISREQRVALIKSENRLAREIPQTKTKKVTFEKSDPDPYGSRHKIRSYMIQRKCPGEDLLKILLKKDQLTIDQRFQLSLHLCKALKMIHERGITHRDIKPENIKVDLATMEVNILDFGFARRIPEKDHRSLGTPFYAAPEILTDPEYADERCDNYSMGLILRELWEDEVWQSYRQDHLNVRPSLIFRNKIEAYSSDKKVEIDFSATVKQQLKNQGFAAGELARVLAEVTRAVPRNRLSLRHTLSDLTCISEKRPLPARKFYERHPIITCSLVGLGIAVLASATIAAIVWTGGLAGVGISVAGAAAFMGSATLGSSVAAIAAATGATAFTVAGVAGGMIMGALTAAVFATLGAIGAAAVQVWRSLMAEKPELNPSPLQPPTQPITAPSAPRADVMTSGSAAKHDSPALRSHVLPSSVLPLSQSGIFKKTPEASQGSTPIDQGQSPRQKP